MIALKKGEIKFVDLQNLQMLSWTLRTSYLAAMISKQEDFFCALGHIPTKNYWVLLGTHSGNEAVVFNLAKNETYQIVKVSDFSKSNAEGQITGLHADEEQFFVATVQGLLIGFR